jgi:hypothetical protein
MMLAQTGAADVLDRSPKKQTPNVIALPTISARGIRFVVATRGGFHDKESNDEDE